MWRRKKNTYQELCCTCLRRDWPSAGLVLATPELTARAAGKGYSEQKSLLPSLPCLTLWWVMSTLDGQVICCQFNRLRWCRWEICKPNPVSCWLLLNPNTDGNNACQYIYNTYIVALWANIFMNIFFCAALERSRSVFYAPKHIHSGCFMLFVVCRWPPKTQRLYQ